MLVATPATNCLISARRSRPLGVRIELKFVLGKAAARPGHMAMPMTERKGSEFLRILVTGETAIDPSIPGIGFEDCRSATAQAAAPP